jgi:hypothetical protein
VDRSLEGVGTELVDLTTISLAEFRLNNSRQLVQSTERVLKQTQRPRANLGGTGPPGRAD